MPRTTTYKTTRATVVEVSTPQTTEDAKTPKGTPAVGRHPANTFPAVMKGNLDVYIHPTNGMVLIDACLPLARCAELLALCGRLMERTA